TPPGRTCTSSTKTRPVASCWKKHPLNPEAITRHGRPPEICVDTERCGIPLLQFFVSDLSGQPASDDKPDVVASRVTLDPEAPLPRGGRVHRALAGQDENIFPRRINCVHRTTPKQSVEATKQRCPGLLDLQHGIQLM